MKKIIILSVAGIIFLIYCHLETRWIKTTEIKITSPDIPPAFTGKKLVFIADIHHGPYLSIKRVKKLVVKINNLKPDLVLMGGDYVHRKPKYITPFFDELRNLKTVHGVYAVLGNHDHWEDPALIRQMMLRNEIRICDNKSYWIQIDKDSIKIGGVGDLWEENQILENTTFDIDKSDFCILIAHNPDYLEDIKTDLIDLTLSGHTHGGQMTFFGNSAPVLPIKNRQKYRYGLIQSGKMQSYITSGVGTVTPPVRFFCRPEIVLFELQNE